MASACPQIALMQDGRDMQSAARADVPYKIKQNLKAAWNLCRLLLDTSDLSDRRPAKRPRSAAARQPAADDDELEVTLDAERYADLHAAVVGAVAFGPSPSESGAADLEKSRGGAAIPFVYPDSEPLGGPDAPPTDDEKRAGPYDQAEDPFSPPFAIPGHLKSSAMPATDRHFRIMKQTAGFVRGRGSRGTQLEVLLRVKHADDPNFTFLLPEDPLHSFYRWLVATGSEELGAGDAAPEVGGRDAATAGPASSHLSQPAAGLAAEEAGQVDEAAVLSTLPGLLSAYDSDGEEEHQQPAGEPELQDITAVSSLATSTDGPSDEDHAAMRKLASFVARNGPGFEDVVRSRGAPQGSHTSFAFLDPGHPHHARYRKALAEALALSGSSAGETGSKSALGAKTMKMTTSVPPWVKERMASDVSVGLPGAAAAAESHGAEEREPLPEDESREPAVPSAEIASPEDAERERKMAERRRRAQQLLARNRWAAAAQEAEDRQQHLRAISSHKRAFSGDDGDG
jgi:hypothetical protein